MFMHETEAHERYTQIFSTDRLERWESWKRYCNTEGHLPEGVDHPLAEVPKEKHRWTGGVTISDGYRMVLVPAHPRASEIGRIGEHILAAEIAFGRFLPDGAVVHHANENRLDNYSEGNLVICENKAYHNMLHRRKRALEACGNPDWRKCAYCKHWDDPANMVIRQGPIYGGQGYHKRCASENSKARWREKNWPLRRKPYKSRVAK
jgi:hypothetical protein